MTGSLFFHRLHNCLLHLNLRLDVLLLLLYILLRLNLRRLPLLLHLNLRLDVLLILNILLLQEPRLFLR